MRAPLASILLLGALAPAMAAEAQTSTVTAMDFFWTPSQLTIAPGESVTFALGEGFHNWERDDGSDSCALPCTRTFADEGVVGFHCGVHPSMTGSITVGSPPTVAIASPAPGQTLSGTVTVTGTASHATSVIAAVTVRLGNAPEVIATLAGDGTSVTWTAELPTTNVADGAQTLVARATTAGGLVATSSILVQVDNPTTLDMVLVTASAQPNGVRTNAISFSVRNDGNEPATGVPVLAEYLYHGTWRAIGSTSVGQIGPGRTATGLIVWSPSEPHVGGFHVRVTVDPAAALPDPDRANNARVVTAGWVVPTVPGIVLTEPV